jgi:hypothetical protein
MAWHLLTISLRAWLLLSNKWTKPSRFGNRGIDCEFREDYSVGTYETTDGSAMLKVHYSGRCRSCGFSKEFDHEETVS